MASERSHLEDEVVPIEEGLELMRAFRRIDSTESRYRVIDLAVALAPKEAPPSQ